MGLCTYCFFAPQIMTFVYRMSNGRLGRMHIAPAKLYHTTQAQNERSNRGRSVPLLKGPESGAPEFIKVTVHAKSMVNSKDVSIQGCTGLADLWSRILSDFAFLQGVDRRSLLLFVLAEDETTENDGSLQWLLVNSTSAMERVLLSEALMCLPEEDAGQDVDDMVVAFPKRPKGGKERLALTSSSETSNTSRPTRPSPKA